MAFDFDVRLMAEDLIAAKTTWSSLEIKRFPSEKSEIVIVNPFILYMKLNDEWWNMAVSFNEYPATILPKILFYNIPPCPLHPQFPHPNINISSGHFNLRPSNAKPNFRINQTIEVMSYILNNPIHYNLACSIPTQIRNQETPSPPNFDLKETLSTIGDVVRTVKTIIEIGQVFGSIISCVV